MVEITWYQALVLFVFASIGIYHIVRSADDKFRSSKRKVY